MKLVLFVLTVAAIALLIVSALRRIRPRRTRELRLALPRRTPGNRSKPETSFSCVETPRSVVELQGEARHLSLRTKDADVTNFQNAAPGTAFIPPETHRCPGPLTAALYCWPGISVGHLPIARRVLNRVCHDIHDRLGLRLDLIPPVEGTLVMGDPAELGLFTCDPCGAFAHGATAVTIVFKPLRDAAGQPVADCGGVMPCDRHRVGAGFRYANVDVSFVLDEGEGNREENLYHVLLHAVLNALARLATKHKNPSWEGPFILPSPNCDLEYRYPSAYGEFPPERDRAAAEGWKHYNQAILKGTAVRYVPLLDDPPDSAPRREKS